MLFYEILKNEFNTIDDIHRNDILDISRQNQTMPLTSWFEDVLRHAATSGHFPLANDIEKYTKNIVSNLTDYGNQTGVNTVVLGMSGGVDSAVTAALFKKAGWRVIGVTMPIEQDPIETQRGKEACIALGLEHKNINLTSLYQETLKSFVGITDTDGEPLDKELDYNNDQATLIRCGNIRARLRMSTLYNLASKYGGLVASTDNYSELSVGFWTLHGDVGDVSPIQSLTKSWEVPALARHLEVPESTWRAKPTDGLGVDDGDESQFGFTYLELDLMLYAIQRTMSIGATTQETIIYELDLNNNPRALDVFNLLIKRMGSTWFKRTNPINLKHPIFHNTRYDNLDKLDYNLFYPEVLKHDE